MFSIYKILFISYLYIYFSSKISTGKTPFPPSSNSPPFSRISYLYIRTHTRNHETNVPRTPKIHIPQSYRSRARNYQSREPGGNEQLSRGNQSQLSARLLRRFHHGSHRQTEREIERGRERDEDDLHELATLRVARNREPRARNSLETIRKPIPGWRASDRATIRSNGWRLEGCIRGAGLKPSHEGLPRVMRVGPESRISARRETGARNRLPDRLTHPWPGLRQTGITRVPAGVVFEAGLQTSPDFSRRFSSLSLAFRGKAERG